MSQLALDSWLDLLEFFLVSLRLDLEMRILEHKSDNTDPFLLTRKWERKR